MITDRLFASYPVKTTLSDDMDIWYVNMDSLDPNNYLHCLSRQERARTERVLNEEKRRHLIISRGILRTVLGSNLNIEPADLNMEIQTNGKPGLCDKALYFNVSHSKELLVIAISKDSELGVDVEWIDEGIDPRQSASIAFSREENVYLERCGYSVTKFFDLWSMKEAVLKAAGWGFSYPSNRFSVISSKDQSIQSSIMGDVTNGSPCMLYPFDLFPGFSGAIAEIPQITNPARN